MVAVYENGVIGLDSPDVVHKSCQSLLSRLDLGPVDNNIDSTTEPKLFPFNNGNDPVNRVSRLYHVGHFQFFKLFRLRSMTRQLQDELVITEPEMG